VFGRRVLVVGTGYVGLTTGVCLASLGHRVVCADIDTAKVERLRRGVVDIVEPGLAELMGEQVTAGRLSFVSSAAEGVTGFDEGGSAVHDFLNPDRIVVGCDTQDPAERVSALYARLGAPTVLTDAASAELVKYAANCFLAMKLSYVNAMAELCERVGADIADVTEGIGSDSRIGSSYLSPGPGWGGSCLPKDTHALLQVADAADFEFRLLRATIDTNTRQRQRIVDKVRQAVTGRRTGSLTRVRLGLLGLTFKAGTDDLRDSPALAIAALLRQAGADLVGYDPALVERVGTAGSQGAELEGVRLVADPLEAAEGAEALVVLTEWPAFRGLDWAAVAATMKTPIVVDTRNLLDPATLRRAHVTTVGLGRPEGAPAVP
jgi:UDPglucose 6-dehydrogenase